MRISDWSSTVCSSDLTVICKLDRVNQRDRSKANVAHHYDLSDRLYELFLDRDRQYSCAYFIDPDNSLEQAQLDKKAHIAAKLALKPGQRVLDIGCGWGGMALYLHEKCRSEEHTSELQSLMRISYAVFCLNKQKNNL